MVSTCSCYSFTDPSRCNVPEQCFLPGLLRTVNSRYHGTLRCIRSVLPEGRHQGRRQGNRRSRLQLHQMALCYHRCCLRRMASLLSRLDILDDPLYKEKIRPINDALARRIYERAYVDHSILNESF